jgi:DNA invertase Pin-like site-specific DNA recombinase
MEQAEQGLSLPAQKQRIADYCKLYGLRLSEVLSDDGLSAKTTANRPKALRVIELVRKRQVDGVVFVKLDRFFRRTTEAIEFAELCRKKNVVLHSITEKLDTSTAMGEFFFTLMAALGQMESRRIGERTAEVLRHKRMRGEKTGGTPPFGYRVRCRKGRKVLVPDEREQAVLSSIWSRRGKGCSVRQIAAELEAAGICTKTGRKTWSPSTIHKILGACPVHVGPKVNRKGGKVKSNG